MRDLFDKEFQKEMDDFFDYIDHEVLGKPKDEPYDHSIDTIDPDEPDIPGPPYDSYGYNDDDDFLDKYCEKHPDFNDAMNGMVWEPEHLVDR